MKKATVFLLALVMALSLCACGGADDAPPSQPADAAPPESVEPAGTEPTAEPPAESGPSYEITDSRARTWTNSIGTVWVQTIVEITNTGSTNLYLASGAYDLEAADGSLVASQTLVSTYPDVLAPGEKGYMYEETTLDAPVDGELKVLPRPDIKEATIELIRFPVTDIALSDESYGGIKLMGRVENTSSELQNMVYVTAFLYDADNACIGSVFTILSEDIAAGSKIGFEMTGFSLPDDVTSAAVASYTVYAYPLQFQF